MDRPQTPAASGPSKVRPRQTRSHRRRPVSLREIAYALAMFACLAVLAKFAADSIRLSMNTEHPQSADQAGARVGSIVVQNNNGTCRVMKFDNSTGQTLQTSTHCDEPEVLDSHGVPVPTGTVHRLESISKSFRGGD